jgi:hypothetical protein
VAWDGDGRVCRVGACACFEYSFDGLAVDGASAVADACWKRRDMLDTVYWTVDWLDADDRPDDRVELLILGGFTPEGARRRRRVSDVGQRRPRGGRAEGR